MSENDKIFKNKNGTALFAEKTRDGDESWIASNGHYFAALIMPDAQNYKYFFDYREKIKITTTADYRAIQTNHSYAQIFIFISDPRSARS